jgi:3-methyladenine DNA glycosylase AlkD
MIGKSQQKSANANAMEFTRSLNRLLRQHGDSTRAVAMEKYMKNKFVFFGIPQSRRRMLFKDFLKANGIPIKDSMTDVVFAMLAYAEREMHYCAMELMQKKMKEVEKDDIEIITEMIVTHSWWDTVDYIAVHLAGAYFRAFPESANKVTDAWMQSGNLWLQRSAILFQLKYREKTDTALLFGLIAKSFGSKEFFIRKAAGWALRELSKTQPTAVREFVESHTLSGLTVREAMKYV